MSPDPVSTARRLCDELLRPDAERVDREGVDPASLKAIAQAGLLGLSGPKAYGGAEAAPSVGREVTALLAGADLSTWFVTTQHGMPLAMLAASANTPLKDAWLGPMCTGGALAGVAVAHLRRPGAPAVTATETDGGWRFDGHVGWMTSWGLCDVFLLGGLTDDGRVVFGLVPAVEGNGLCAGPRMQLAAMQATSTVALDLDGFAVPSAAIVSVTDLGNWKAKDAAKTANITPAVFGLHEQIVRRLTETGQSRNDRTITALADRLAAEAEDLRIAAYALIDHVPAAEQIEDRLDLRAHALELVVRAAAVLVTATGGGAMAVTSPAQRHLREAAFLLVQAQTGAIRSATLQRWSEQTA